MRQDARAPATGQTAPLTQQAHARLAERLRPGDWVLDATAGNGHDTLFLARQVGPQGRVWAWDTQAAALAATADRPGSTQLTQCLLSEHVEQRLTAVVDVVARTMGREWWLV